MSALDALAELDHRFVFVVGKGGVGKTTTAGAVALAAADAGTDTLLLSTDPAHSLGDLFEAGPASGDATPAPCQPRLHLRELDAPAYVDGWIERFREPVRDLFDRGTYLDGEDVDPFLDLALPGIDEVAAILFLAETASDGRYGRVVVDTAPTGHTLRLLEAHEVVDSWAEAFRAMAEKVHAVSRALVGRDARVEAEELVAELGERVARFRDEVVGRAAAVVVTRAGSVVEAETRRLEEGLEARGFRHVVRVRVGERSTEAAADELAVPLRAGLQGCEALRGWGDAEDDGAAAGAAQGSGDPALPRLRGSGPRLLFFVGKGGVGKSTCAAAWALALAEDEPVTLVGVDPAGSLEDVLGGAEVDGLRVHQVDADGAFGAFRERYRASVSEAFHRLAGGAELDHRVVASLLELAPPGLDEIFAVTALMEELEGDARVVVDTAPTGHLLRLLAMPDTGLGWTRELMRILLKYRAVLELDAFAERLLVFARRLKAFREELADPARAGAVVVRQPGPLVAAESGRLVEGLARAGLSLHAVLDNRAGGAPEPDAGGRTDGALRITAPALDEPPVGPDALRTFLSRWRVSP